MKMKCDECDRTFNPMTKGATNDCGPVCSKKRVSRNCSHEECKGSKVCLSSKKDKKQKNNSSVRICKNCGKENPHTKNCHVIAQSLESIRVGIETKGGIQRYSIVQETSSLKQTRIKRGFFWCDYCETNSELGGIDNNFVPKIKSMIQKRLDKGLFNREVVNLSCKDKDFDLFHKSMISMAIRKNIFSNKNNELKNYTKIQLQWNYFEIPKTSILALSTTRVDNENEIEIKEDYIQLILNFGEGHSLNIFLHN